MRFTIYILVLSFGVQEMARAESPEQMIQQLQQSISSANQASSSEDAAQMQPIPTITMPQPPPPQDRANKNGAAKALAMAGAAMAMVGCMKLMNDAKKAEDEQTKAMLQAMAMQQCSQGMKDMADAMKNDENKKQLTMSDTPKLSQLSAGQFQSSKAKPKESNLLGMGPSSSESQAPVFTDTPMEVPKEEPATGNRMEDQLDTDVVETPNYPKSSLKPIQAAQLKMDESSRGGGTTPPAGLNPNAVYTGNSNKPADAAQKQAAGNAAGDLNHTGEGTRAKKGTEAGEGGSGDGGSDSKSGGADPFEGMLGQLFGKKDDPFTAGGATTFGGEATAPANAAGKKVNIFEYATFRYQQARTQSKLKGPASRAVASINKAAAKPVQAKQ